MTHAPPPALYGHCFHLHGTRASAYVCRVSPAADPTKTTCWVVIDATGDFSFPRGFRLCTIRERGRIAGTDLPRYEH